MESVNVQMLRFMAETIKVCRVRLTNLIFAAEKCTNSAIIQPTKGIVIIMSAASRRE
jgi:hypothetical protein